MEHPGGDGKVVVIACGKAKNRVPSCAAKDAYVGVSFRAKRALAEGSGLPWFILSAKYGLLRPDTQIDPDYDVTVRSRGQIHALAATVRGQLCAFPELAAAREILFLGPAAYATALALALGEKGAAVTHLTGGLSQGRALARTRELAARFSGKEG